MLPYEMVRKIIKETVMEITHPYLDDFEEYYYVSPKVIREDKKSKWTHRWYVVKKDHSKASYVVSMAKGQEFGCSCPVWKFQRTECHHIKGIKQSLFKYLMDERVEMNDHANSL